MTNYVSSEREVLTLAEAADFLRLSVSTMHQKRNIPRHRLPGSREYRYLRSELLMWLKGVPHTGNEAVSTGETQPIEQHLQQVVDISSQHVYHRNPRYR
jgi:hypothetical protein